MITQFASSYPRSKQGWIQFPRDKADRDKLFVPESYEHPAKANLYLVQSLIDYTTSPGDWIMDITAGTGTILVASPMGRKVIAIELNPLYHEWIELNAQKMGISDCMIFLGDCRDILPQLPKVDLVLTDPPYGIQFRSNHRIERHDWIVAMRCQLESAFDELTNKSQILRTLQCVGSEID